MKKQTVLTTATFGAAIAALGVAPELQADIVDLTFTPSTNAPGGLDPIDIDQVPGTVEFSQWNDGLGKTLLAAGDLTGVGVVALGDVIDPATFVGASAIGSADGFTASATGTAYVGFITTGGNVGWFSLDLGGADGTITYLDGQFGTAGEAVVVPAAGGLGLLAMGAAGLGRTRKRSA